MKTTLNPPLIEDREPGPKVFDGKDGQPTVNREAKPNQTPTGGYKKRHLPWNWILGAIAVVLVTVSVIRGRLAAVPTLANGLVAVNGRFEGDHVIVSSKYSGRISKLGAREGDTVSEGQLLVELDDPETRSKRDQAAAALTAATAQAQGSKFGVDLTRENGAALVLQAQGVVNQSDSGVGAARADALRASSAVTSAVSGQRVAEENVASAQSALDVAISNRNRAQAGLRSSRSQFNAAVASVQSATSSVEASRAASLQADRDAVRYRQLSDDGATTRQVAERAETAASQAKAQLDSAQSQESAAKENSETMRSEVDSASEQVVSAEASIRQAKSLLAASREQARAARAGVAQARALASVASETVKQGVARKQQALGQFDQARATETQLRVSRKTQSQSEAFVSQAEAAVKELDNVLSEMSILSPTAGTVITRFQDKGEVVSAGGPILELVNLDQLYLKVYVPETDIGKIRLGLPARIYTDAFPNQPVEATVGYISSQAEFTPKEIQTQSERVNLMYAVKLYVTRNPDHRLTPGLPADAVIRWRDNVPWPK